MLWKFLDVSFDLGCFKQRTKNGPLVETQKAVFVPLIGLRKSGQMRQGLPLVIMACT